MVIRSTSAKKLNLIQVYRGIAAVLVVLCHGDLIFNQNLNQNFLFKVFNFGGSGVDFFFVLSGFIIWYVHQTDIGNKSKLKLFIIKRFTRVYPLYWVVLILKLSASFMFSYKDVSQLNLGAVIKAFLLFPQDRSLLSSSFLGVSWTLSFEIFFYLIFGLLIGLKPKISIPLVATWLAGTFVHFIGLIQLPKDNLLLQFIFDEHNIEFALGCLAAYILSKQKIKYGMTLISVGAFAYTLSAINFYYNIIELPSLISFGIPATLLVIGATSLESNKTIKIPSLFIYIGNASYSIYLIHGFVINNVLKLTVKLQPEITQNIFILNILGLLISALATICGCLMYSYLEKPLFSMLKPKLAQS